MAALLRVEDFKCVLCGGETGGDVVSHQVKNDASHRLSVVRCGGCRHVQLFPPAYDVAMYERDGQVASVVADYGVAMAKIFEHARLEARRRVDRFSAHQVDLGAAQAGCVLDIGGGYGFFGAEVRRRYPNLDVTVLEPSARRVETGRRELSSQVEAAGLPRFDTTLLTQAYADEHKDRYDFVTLWHVLEHVSDPIDLLRRALFVSKPGAGKIFVEVPNFEDDLLELSPGYLRRHFMVEHISYFTVTSLERLARAAGPAFDIQTHGYQRYGIFNYFNWISTDAPQGENPDMFPGEDRWWLEADWRTSKEQNRTSDALFMIMSRSG